MKMEVREMNLKILLPFCVYTETKKVIQIVMETSKGSFGLLPQRLDCVASLVPGIFTYETEIEGIKYLAIDEGVMVKTGAEVFVSVHSAIGGSDLGNLHEVVKREFNIQNESQKQIHSVIQKLESRFMRSLEQLYKE